MSVLQGFSQTFADVRGVKVELFSKGAGRPFLFLHPGDGLFGAEEALNGLASLGQVIAPSHPGFGLSELPSAITTVDDLSYFYLDFMKALDLRDVVLVGASFGGWIAAEIATKCEVRIGQLILVDAFGIKIGGRESRDIVDLHALDEETRWSLSFLNPRCFPDYPSFPEEDLVQLAKNRETFTLFGWRPYMHNPKLKNRLGRISVRTSVIWGAEDRVVSPTYGRAFKGQIANSEFTLIDEAGHFPYIEQPEQLCDVIKDFTAIAA